MIKNALAFQLAMSLDQKRVQIEDEEIYKTNLTLNNARPSLFYKEQIRLRKLSH